MKRSVLVFLSLNTLAIISMSAQPTHRDTAVFIEKRNEFYDSIKTSLDTFYKKDNTSKKEIAADFEVFNPPHSIQEFKSYWHNKPI